MAVVASSERKRSVESSICRMLVECAYGEGGTGTAIVCSKPARTSSIPWKSSAARLSDTWMMRRFLRTAGGSASSGAAGV